MSIFLLRWKVLLSNRSRFSLRTSIVLRIRVGFELQGLSRERWPETAYTHSSILVHSFRQCCWPQKLQPVEADLLIHKVLRAGSQQSACKLRRPSVPHVARQSALDKMWPHLVIFYTLSPTPCFFNMLVAERQAAVPGSRWLPAWIARLRSRGGGERHAARYRVPSRVRGLGPWW